mmetsp:Transcript_30606/g.66016  ORF Transcript_30606/g.66016 Transcript_30606/m.66016 type:complete len:408 (-) Transcript_30606:82-1305(-)
MKEGLRTALPNLELGQGQHLVVGGRRSLGGRSGLHVGGPEDGVDECLVDDGISRALGVGVRPRHARLSSLLLVHLVDEGHEHEVKCAARKDVVQVLDHGLTGFLELLQGDLVGTTSGACEPLLHSNGAAGACDGEHGGLAGTGGGHGAAQVGSCAAGELQVGAHLLIDVGVFLHALSRGVDDHGILADEGSHNGDAVASETHEGARLGAEHLALKRVADGQVQIDVLDGANEAFQNHLSHALGHRVAGRVGALQKNLVVVLSGSLHGHSLEGVVAHGGLAEHVLAGLESLDRPVASDTGGEDIVDGIDVGVGQHLVEACVGLGDAPLLRELFGLRLLQRSQAGNVQSGRQVVVELPGFQDGEGNVLSSSQNAKAQGLVQRGRGTCPVHGHGALGDSSLAGRAHLDKS